MLKKPRPSALALVLSLACALVPAAALQPPAAPGGHGTALWGNAGAAGAGGGAQDLDEGFLLASPLPAPSPPVSTSAFGDRAVLLCWHSFLGDPALSTDFSLRELAAQLDALLALGYRFVDLDDALAGRFEGRLNIVATIDDGHRTVPDAVNKVFLPRGIRPALFVYPAIIGNIPQAMDEAALRSMAEAGCLIGAHGYHHLYVTESLYRSEPAEFRKEIYKARSRTEAIVGKPVDIYAYPFGAYSPVTLSEVEKAGYGYGIAVKSGFLFAAGAEDETFELPRLVVTRENWEGIKSDLARRAADPAQGGRRE